MTAEEIAAKFQIHQSTVYRILRRKAWRHVSDHPALAIAQAALRAKEAGDV